MIKVGEFQKNKKNSSSNFFKFKKYTVKENWFFNNFVCKNLNLNICKLKVVLISQ